MNLERRIPAPPPEVPACIGMRVVNRASRVAGTITRVLPDGVTIKTPTGERSFRFHPGGFIVNGTISTLVFAAPLPLPAVSLRRTASGSIEDPTAGIARVARASRLWVEGIHDAELVERVWGDDLRSLGIVVERLDGIDVLHERIVAFEPSATRRLGVLVDHLVAGSKEQRLAEGVEDRFGPYVTVRGTPYVDVWQAIRPKVLGFSAWPVVPIGEDWKTGICRRLGAPEPRLFWREIVSRVNSYADLEAPLVAAVEELLDEITAAD